MSKVWLGLQSYLLPQWAQHAREVLALPVVLVSSACPGSLTPTYHHTSNQFLGSNCPAPSISEITTPTQTLAATTPVSTR